MTPIQASILAAGAAAVRPGGVLVSEPAIAVPEFAPVALPGDVMAGRYYIYRRITPRSSP